MSKLTLTKSFYQNSPEESSPGNGEFDMSDTGVSKVTKLSKLSRGSRSIGQHFLRMRLDTSTKLSMFRKFTHSRVMLNMIFTPSATKKAARPASGNVREMSRL